MSGPEAAVIIVNWKQYGLTTHTLDQLARVQGGSRWSIVVFDNESLDVSAAAALGRHPSRPAVLRDARNLGYAGAINAVLRAHAAHCEAFVVLNNDLEFSEDFLTPLVARSLGRGSGAVGPVTFSPDGTVDTCGVDVSVDDPYVVRHRTAVSGSGDTVAVDAVQGHAMAFSRRTLEDVGLLDERYYHMWEETDWCMRMRRHGRTNLLVESSTVVHQGSASLGGASGYNPVIEFMLMRNMLLFLENLGCGARVVGEHIAFWRANCLSTTFRDHDVAPPAMAATVIGLAIEQFQSGMHGRWPSAIDELAAR